MTVSKFWCSLHFERFRGFTANAAGDLEKDRFRFAGVG
jgi:hypothetical protein